MIAPMKKLSVLCLASESEDALDALRDLGVLHVTPTKELSGETSEEAHDHLDEAKQALSTLDAYAHHHTSKDPSGSMDSSKVDALIEEVCKLHQQHRHLAEQLGNLRHTRHSLLPYGDFDPASIDALAESGIFVRLYHARDIEHVEVPEGVQLHVLNTDKTGTHFALIADHAFEVNAPEFHVPKTSLHAVEAEITSTKASLASVNDRLTELAASHDDVVQAVHDRTDAAEYADVHDTIGKHGAIAYLCGFCPEESIDAVREAGAKRGWGLLVEEPANDDAVPTLLKLPRWVTPIKAVMQFLAILPGYHEADISGVFLIFFSIFFAILIGDAGYGLLFLIMTVWIRIKKPQAPAYPFVLFGILSTCTILWGAATGNYFGISPEALPPLLQGLQVDWLTSEMAQNNVMKLCFLIGAIHLTIAHLWNIVVLAPSPKALAQIGWIGLVWSMYSVALGMVLQQPYPGFFLPLLIVSTLMILLFMTSPKDMKDEWINHAMFPLSMVNCFVDIVSYIRLFAVGLASLSVAESFNGMAMQLGWARIWTVPFIAAILLIGHGLNIALCALGILVHGVRLNTLEFSLHKGLEWKGVPYRPFSRVPR